MCLCVCVCVCVCMCRKAATIIKLGTVYNIRNERGGSAEQINRCWQHKPTRWRRRTNIISARPFARRRERTWYNGGSQSETSGVFSHAILKRIFWSVSGNYCPTTTTDTIIILSSRERLYGNIIVLLLLSLQTIIICQNSEKNRNLYKRKK